nr:hypothetical transcript [Hymenolepis microstoma]
MVGYDLSDKKPIDKWSIIPASWDLSRFITSALPLAIHELDTTHVGKFSFKSKVNVAEAMKESRTVPRSALVDEYLENLKSGVREDTKRKAITFDMDYLNEFIRNNTNDLMRMQREASEQ